MKEEKLIIGGILIALGAIVACAEFNSMMPAIWFLFGSGGLIVVGEALSAILRNYRLPENVFERFKR